VQRLGGDGLAARDLLELFVRTGHTEAAHHGLDRFGQHLPGAVQVGGQRRFIEFQLVQAGQQRDW
jgi:hypothetical protein